MWRCPRAPRALARMLAGDRSGRNTRDCPLSDGESLSRQGQRTRTDAGRSGDCVADRGRDWRYRRLANSSNFRISALEHLHGDVRRLVHPEQRVAVEIRFEHAPVLQCDGAKERCRQPEMNAALDLGLDVAWI